MTLLLALALLASGGASASIDAGDAPRIVSVRHALAVGDDGRTYELDGGVWTDTRLSIDNAKELAGCRAIKEVLREEPPPPPPPKPTRASEILAAFTAGIAAAVSVLGLAKKL